MHGVHARHDVIRLHDARLQANRNSVAWAETMPTGAPLHSNQMNKPRLNGRTRLNQRSPPLLRTHACMMAHASTLRSLPVMVLSTKPTLVDTNSMLRVMSCMHMCRSGVLAMLRAGMFTQ